MKKKFLLAGFLSIALLLAGCVEQNTHVVINADGSADISQDVLLSEELASMAEAQGENISDSMLEELSAEIPEGKGYKLEAAEVNGKQGVRLSKHFDNLEDIFESQFFTSEAVKDGTIENPWTVEVDKGFFATNTHIKGELNNKEWIKEYAGLSEEEAAMMSTMENSFEFSYSLTTPVKAISHNADKEDNRTYTWSVSLDENQTVEIEYHVLNMTNVGFVVGFGVVLLIAVPILIRVARKQKRSGQQDQ